MDAILTLFSDPATWAALITVITLEVVLGIDNLALSPILANELPAHRQWCAGRVEVALLSGIACLVGLTATVFDLGVTDGSGA